MTTWPLRQRDIFEILGGFSLVYFLFFLFSLWLSSVPLEPKYNLTACVSNLISSNHVKIKKNTKTIIISIFSKFIYISLHGPAPFKRGILRPWPRPWREVTTDRSTTQQLARFRSLQDPGDEGHGVGREGEDTDGYQRQEANRKAGANRMRTRTPKKLLFRS